MQTARQIFGTSDKRVPHSLILPVAISSTVSTRESCICNGPAAFFNHVQETTMPATSDKPYEPISFAKKHRISVEDARVILDEAAGDKKAADKHARRVSV